MKPTFIAAIPAFAVAAFMLYIGIAHNPQCEFYCGDSLLDNFQYAHAATLFVFWFALVWFTVIIPIYGIFQLRNRKKGTR